MPGTDAELVRRVLAGDLRSFTGLVGRYEAALLRYATSIVGDGDDAADVVQDAFIKAYRNLPAYNVRRPFSPWIYRIVRNEALNWLRHHRRVVTGEAAGAYLALQPAQGMSAHEAVEYDETVELLRAGLASLPLSYREPLLLYYVEGKQYAEIGDILRIPEGTVATRIRRGKAKLKVMVAQRDEVNDAA